MSREPLRWKPYQRHEARTDPGAVEKPGIWLEHESIMSIRFTQADDAPELELTDAVVGGLGLAVVEAATVGVGVVPPPPPPLPAVPLLKPPPPTPHWLPAAVQIW